jgi:hypothetical protein
MPASTAQRATTKRPNPRDYTGKQKAAAEAAVAAEQEQRAEELSMLAEVEADRRENDVVDYTQGGYAAPAPEQPTPRRGVHPELAAEIEQAMEVEVGPKDVEVRVNSKIEQMVYGRQVLDDGDPMNGIPARLGNLQFYDFEEGVRYRVPVELARHLDELGYLWH